MKKYNRLITASSAYLLQHATNPVDWFPWGQEALSKAQQEDKPILLSIGYTACHWCHVMAHESFEDAAVAALMNQYFINIKVDRQEYPAIDQVSMAAMQAMGLAVGWPLQLFLLPNQQPFYGGTYFPKQAWKQLLQSIANAFVEKKIQLYKSAFFFTETIQSAIAIIPEPSQSSSTGSLPTLAGLFEQLYQSLDTYHGGIGGEPKFLMPTLSAFLLAYYYYQKDHRAWSQVQLTLMQAAKGGIYDHLHGGFFRYTVDKAWRIPHFEKMLYDNAQLISIYAHVYTINPDPIYKNVLSQTLTFLEREMYAPEGAFYAALDADSQGREGAYYLWTYAEIANILGEDLALFSQYFAIRPAGNWHQGYNILYKNAHYTTDPAVQTRLSQLQQLLHQAGIQRPRPLIDKQIIASWNGLTMIGLVAAYWALEEPHWLALATNVGHFIAKCLVSEGQLCHSYTNGKRGQPGYLEDYVWVGKACIDLYQATLDDRWLAQAQYLIDYALAHFPRKENRLYCSTQEDAYNLLKNPQEVFDQVIPSSNAALAHAVFELSYLCYQPSYDQIADDLLQAVLPLLKNEPVHMTHWAVLYTRKIQGAIVVTLLGSERLAWARSIKKQYPYVLINHWLAGGIPGGAEVGVEGDTEAYLCHKDCQGPFYGLPAILQAIGDR